ncbi:hypothetical protein At15955_52200 (plasmid) [Agrobacterium tumefaciens]|nr:hypothetical protein X971_5256 [Agrobacterium tumefaciens LBA4213 (Ach5)]AKC10822.1 hypothetical protein Ach5_50590 [Agrobacterium tumefaciens]AYM20205.1 hypothetical protein At15955_52200 [Agrobacterium tumefaciens]AYM71508.1 hypothetical protein AtA6_52920 [Agrobacterium tumefaciens]CUX05221.1 conserved membrane hypothetical protein [Agrobacterium fabacearum TT111]
MRMMTDRRKNALAYGSLIVLQSLAVAFLLRAIFPIFYAVVTHLGERQQVPVSTLLTILAVALLLQASYWTRMRWVEVRAPFHSIFVSHLLSFAARLAFLFGGVLFSTIFFRHLPESNTLPPLGHTVLQGALILLVLFSFFCYSVELERLAKAIEDPAET